MIHTSASFEIKNSTVPSIGKGLFTKVLINKNDTIGYYKGKILTDKQVYASKKHCNSLYLLWVCKDHWICGEHKSSNYTRFLNHSSKPNAVLIVSNRWKTARFAANKKILPGSEIFFDYGDGYWTELNIQPK